MNPYIIPAALEARVSALQALTENTAIEAAVSLIIKALRAGQKILVFGNGGSATQAGHFAAELVNRFLFDRPALPAISLATDIAALTAIANDDDYCRVFSRQIQALGKTGDIALGLTTSGSSANVLTGLATAREIGLETIALTGYQREALEKSGCGTIISVASNETPVIQEVHLFILHLLAEVIEKSLFGGKNAHID